jgi:hypothetical protein
LEKENKKIELQQIVDGEEIRVESNYLRELFYNLEHCIHHQVDDAVVLKTPLFCLVKILSGPFNN